MHAVDVLAAAPRRPHCEGVEMKQLTAGETLSDELPGRGLQKTSMYHHTEGAVRAHLQPVHSSSECASLALRFWL